MMRLTFRERIKALPTWSKILLGILLAFLIILFVSTIYLNYLVNRRLKQIVHKASNELYQLEYQRVRIIYRYR